MERHELTQTEDQRCQLDERQGDEDESNGRCQALVPIRVRTPGAIGEPPLVHAQTVIGNA
jgi:hypothetical protein